MNAKQTRSTVNERQTRAPVPSVAVEVVTAVAGRAGVDETELPPLSDVVDPDALDRLFGRSFDDASGAPVEVGFEYSGYRVVVDGDRSVSLERCGRTSDLAVRAR